MDFGSQEVVAERRGDGAVLLRARGELAPYPEKLTDRLEYWAARAPDRVLFAQRAPAGGWRSITYAQALQRAQAIGGYLLKKEGAKFATEVGVWRHISVIPHEDERRDGNDRIRMGVLRISW